MHAQRVSAGLVAALGLAVVAVILSTTGRPAACAAPPSGWHRADPTITELAVTYGPAFAVFFAGGYVALGARHRLVRVLGLVLAAALAGVVFAVELLLAAPGCGRYVP